MSSSAPYVLHSAYETVSEASRLDTLNDAFMHFFRGRLSLAPISIIDNDPHDILDLGCGSGAWAISAANYFPKAKVVATDINPVPLQSTLPMNFHFVQHDVLTPFPFPMETFDIIHARLLLLHLPGVESVLKRISDILKPGGIIILEDPDDEHIDEDGIMQGVAGKSPLVAALHKLMRQRKADPCIGRRHSSILNDIGCFSEVQSTKLILPLTKANDSSIDPTIARLTKAWKQTYKSITITLPALHKEQGIGPELASQFIRDLDNGDANLISVLYLTWAKKDSV